MTLLAPVLTVTDQPTPGAYETLFLALHRLTETQLGLAQDLGQALIILLSDPLTAEVIGGLWGSTYLGHLHIGILFIPEDLRGQGLGTRLVRMAEEEALRRGCNGVWLQSYDFQAAGFYERLGYKTFGTIDDYPPGRALVFLKKTLRAGS
jgi:GNAT superfamily N-acetyltransferase